ncbi:maleylpyruvate isomerase family mycothiol-dependent enzyme [Nocardia brasiliensis]|uniref:maleylpyruvate isomerase family mycothiol-dependent enzyme n=1 Tax=Nocardia brasiliensis TaxID=37326 RepID=UPI0018931E40|nr:maleylpyruvate isomerase family mycothiol-dependent enzyme [Nocardia brasiliensis]MBF6545649.1 maleylpyruvate isomerase family mycothiol-dependent enzyme [Nocardia brasiliensis]
MTSDAEQSPVSLDVLAEATDRLLDTIRKLSDDDLTGPSLLPGWTRGHVLAHLARNADSVLNLLLWAHTGVEIPQYASMFLRDFDIEAGAPRPLDAQLADNEAAAKRWAAVANSLTDAAWHAEVRTRQGRPIPATEVRWMRLQEVEIHHVDLDAGFSPADWPASFVARILAQATVDMNRLTAAATTPTPAFEIRATDTDFVGLIGTGTASDTITGTAAALAAWLLGRSAGGDLSGDLPTLPDWK